MRYLLFAPCLLLLLLCGCGSGQTGIYESPVKMLVVNDAGIPTGTLTDGDSVEFTITWENGRAPYTIYWGFGNGATPNTIEQTSEDLSESITVTLVNATDAPVEYEGYVTIRDLAGDSQSSPVVFTVNPAS